MFTLLARRLTLASRTVHPVVAHRTLFATPRFNYPPAKNTRKTTRKPPKRGRPAVTKKKSSKEEKQRVRVPKELKPPKRAPGAYFLFYSSLLKSQPQATTLQECQQLAKRAGEMWKGYSMAEKQPFYDENEGRKTQAKEELDKYFEKTSPSDLKKLNAIRKAQGRHKIHSTKKSSRPISPFFLFSSEFRTSTDGRELINGTSPEKNYAVRAALAAGARWNAMTTEEKTPFIERFEKAREQWKAEKAEKTKQAQS